jgi:hypothetical protein
VQGVHDIVWADARSVCLNSFESEEKMPGGAQQDNSQNRRGISRLWNTLERKTVWEEAQHRVTEHSIRLFQEGIDQVRVCTGETHFGVLETLRKP